jgi:hypothetical protein
VQHIILTLDSLNARLASHRNSPAFGGATFALQFAANLMTSAGATWAGAKQSALTAALNPSLTPTGADRASYEHELRAVLDDVFSPVVTP